MPRLIPFVLASCALLAVALRAHPNHNATQRTSVDLIPATEPAPGSSEVKITVESDRRIIVANGLPDHSTGRFPNADNPNRVRAQSYRFTVPAHPQPNKTATPLGRQPFGIAVNGVLFDPGTAEFWHDEPDSGWHYDALGNAFSLGLDANNAHVQPNGAYHYHGIPAALLRRLAAGKNGLTLLGWAADGFPIYGVSGETGRLRSSYRLKPGGRPGKDGQPGGKHDGAFVEDFEYVAGSGDLDECGGRIGVTPEFPNGTYHYVLTPDFPFVPRAFRGAPDASFARRGPGSGGPDGRRPPPRGF